MILGLNSTMSRSKIIMRSFQTQNDILYFAHLLCRSIQVVHLPCPIPPTQYACPHLIIQMPEVSGIELHAILKQRKLNIPVIFITGHANVSMSVQAIKAGQPTSLKNRLTNQI